MKPLELAKAKYSKEKFNGLGYVTVYETKAQKPAADPESKEIFTWCVSPPPPPPRSPLSKTTSLTTDLPPPTGTSTAA